MNNNADLSDVKTAITNGQQRAANVKYRNIVNGYQAALQVVDDVVLKNYIGNLTKMPVVPLSKDILENNIKNNVLFFKITEMVYEKEEFATYKFASVFNSLATTESAVFVIIDSDGIKTDFYMGVRSLDSERTTSSLRDTVENAMKGQFPGIKTTDYTIEEMESILEKIQANSISSVSCVANSKAHTIESNKNFVQGLEKLVLSMQGEKYTGIIIANGTTSDQLRELRKGYESVYTQMSPFATTQVNYMGNKTVNYTFTETEGKSRSTSHTTNSSESETETTSSGSSITNGESKESVAGKTLKGISSAASIIGAALGPLTGGMSLAVGGVVAGGVGLLGNAVQKTVSNSTTVNESISHSIAKVSGVSDGITEGVNYGTSKSEGYTNGMSEGMTLTLHDKSVETMLERIDKQLKRIDEFESLGMYECAAYFLSENQYAAEVAASTYKALMRGENSGVEISAVNSWGKSEKEITKQIGQYVTNFIHPVFRYWYRYVALIVLLLGAAGVLKWQLDETRKTSERTTQTISLAQGSPLLVLADGRTMLLNDSVGWGREADLQQVRLDEQGITYQQSDSLEKEEVFNTLIIPKGGEFQIQLADGSRVWLNSETELRYPVNFTAEKRRVFLKGEAYFEVAKNAQIPFVVTTSAGIDVKVLGTKFNVASYENDEQVTTTLAEGSVEVGDEKGSVRLKPEEQALFCKGDRSLRVQKVDVGMYLAWKDGKFIFEEQSLEQIMKQLQRWYEMSVFYTNEEVKQYTFSGDLKKYDDFDKIIRMLEEVSGIKISIKENCVVIGTK